MWILSVRSENILHVIDVGKRFNNGGFINNLDSKRTWRRLRQFSIDVHHRAHDYIHTDSWSNFIVSEFEQYADDIGTTIWIALPEGHNEMEVFERSQANLKTIYEKSYVDLPHITLEERFSLTFRSLNVTPSSTKLIAPTTPIFGIFPKITGGYVCQSLMCKAAIISVCMKVVDRTNA